MPRQFGLSITHRGINSTAHSPKPTQVGCPETLLPDLISGTHFQLRDYRFEWVLPGRGRRFHTDAEQMRQELQRCLDWMPTVT
jgi:hypothetical protein